MNRRSFFSLLPFSLGAMAVPRTEAPRTEPLLTRADVQEIHRAVERLQRQLDKPITIYIDDGMLRLGRR
jgi:hypothetical protein